ncbi:MAG: glycosyltransferase family 2 protein [Bacteroidales bacterium]
MIFISIIIPCYNEEKYIEGCLNSILKSEYPLDFMELIIVDGGSSDNTLTIIKNFIHKFSLIKVLHNPHKTVPFAMNMGIKEARGEYIIRLDAHSTYPKEYFSKLIKYAIILNSDNIGGVCLTEVKTENYKSIAIKEVLSNKFGIGNSLFRVGVDQITEADTVVFGCFKKSVFERFGYYDERLERNQDIELNKRIKRGGGKIFLVPEITCTYYAPDKFTDFIKKNFNNGKWNILTVYITKRLGSLSVRHFFPLLFLLSLIVPSTFSLIYFPLIYISLVSFIIYSILYILISLNITTGKNTRFMHLWISFWILHISYGVGSLYGIFRLPFLKNE